MKLSKIFYQRSGTGLVFAHMQKNNSGIPFVSASKQNNGVVGFVEKIAGLAPISPHTISVAVNGSVMASFLQEKAYYTSKDVVCLFPKTKLKTREMIYYCLCLKKHAFKYPYNRRPTKHLLDLEIPDKVPSWVYQLPCPIDPKAIKI